MVRPRTKANRKVSQNLKLARLDNAFMDLNPLPKVCIVVTQLSNLNALSG